MTLVLPVMPPKGANAVTAAALTGVKLDAEESLKVTSVAPARFRPVMVTSVPEGPPAGVKFEIVAPRARDRWRHAAECPCDREGPPPGDPESGPLSSAGQFVWLACRPYGYGVRFMSQTWVVSLTRSKLSGVAGGNLPFHQTVTAGAVGSTNLTR